MYVRIVLAFEDEIPTANLGVDPSAATRQCRHRSPPDVLRDSASQANLQGRNTGGVEGAAASRCCFGQRTAHVSAARRAERDIGQEGASDV